MKSAKKSRSFIQLNYQSLKIIFYAALTALAAAIFWYQGSKEILPPNVLTEDNYNDVEFRELVGDEKAVKPYIMKIGPKEALERLERISSGGSAFDCHQEAHNIGRAAYELFREEAFAKCQSACHSGCYHGAMEVFLRDNGTKNLAKNISRICESFDSSFGTFECLHGVGHGVMAYLSYDLPESIKECQKLNSNFAARSCYGGTFMENILTGQGLGAAKEQHETTWVSRGDPHYPCNKIDQDSDIQFECYQMQTSWMLYINGYDFNKVVQECKKSREDMIPVCYKSYGRDAAGHTLRNPVKILDLCDKVPREYYDQCITGAVNVIVDFWGSALKDQAAELCQLTPSIGKQACWRTLAWRITDVFTDKTSQQVRCGEFEENYQYLCRK